MCFLSRAVDPKVQKVKIRFTQRLYILSDILWQLGHIRSKKQGPLPLCQSINSHRIEGNITTNWNDSILYKYGFL